MRELQILILDALGVQVGELDLTDSNDFALKLTKSIASINDIGRRNTSFSLDFEVPQTKNNNKLLAGLRFATASKEILGQKECSIIVDGNQIDKGFVYPYESEFDGMYKLVFKGLNNDWVERLRDVELNQLNWRDYLTGLRTEDALELFSGARFGVLSSQNSINVDLIYPVVNRNNGGAAADLRPQLHLRSIVLSMFEKIGYTVSSAFLESDWVKAGTTGIAYTDAHSNPYTHLGLSVDPSFQMIREPQDLLSESVNYTATAPVVPDPAAWATNEMMGNISPSYPTANIRKFYRFPNLIDNLVLDNSARFNVPTSEFTMGQSGSYSVEFFFNYEWGYFEIDPTINRWLAWGSPIVTNNDNYTGVSSTFVPPGFKWYIVKNNTSDTVIDGTILYQVTLTATQQRNIHFLTKTHTFAAGDRISIFLELIDNANGFFTQNVQKQYLNGKPPVFLSNPNGSLNNWRLKISKGSELKVTPVSQLKLGDPFRINSHIPKGIKCLSLLQDFKTMFNLYFDVDVNRKIVFIEPRDDFYNNTFLDITDKIDLNKPPVLNYLTDYKNEMVFKYAVDSKDKYLEHYNKNNDIKYAELTYQMGNNLRFEKGKSTLTTQLISPTIQGELENSVGIMSSIIKEEFLDADNLNKPVNQNYAPRVFQLIRGRQFEPSNVARRTLSPLVLTVAMMEDFANTPTFEDRRLTFNATKGLVSEYYAKTIANIEDTAILTVDLVLSLYGFTHWDLRRTYFISEPAEIAGYYITDSIKNFNVTKETPTTITLVKFKDFIPVAVPGGVGNVNVIISPPPQPQEIVCTVNGAIVACLDNNLKKMYRK